MVNTVKNKHVFLFLQMAAKHIEMTFSNHSLPAKFALLETGEESFLLLWSPVATSAAANFKWLNKSH